jgi:hypothetical protein
VTLDLRELPSVFIDWCYRGRADLVRRLAGGEDIAREKIFLSFTRHSPAIITTGPAGINGSIKGVGFVPKPHLMEEVLRKYVSHIDSPYTNDYSRKGLSVLCETIYGTGGEDMIDFTKLATVELAKGHTWLNMQSDRSVTLLFFEPPVVSFEVRASAEVHESGLYHTFVNAQHDVYHAPNRGEWENRPVYVFKIEEIYDNSATKAGFGRLVYRCGG